ncbi:MAG: response regulator, partial [Nitrospinota bacterium]
TVLVVEDSHMVRNLVREMLEFCGYTVLEASDGAEAIQLCTRHAGAIHLLITDVVMPQMSGWELAERLTALYPQMRVLYMSGYPEKSFPARRREKGKIHFVQKPFTMETLLRKVREAITGSALDM